MRTVYFDEVAGAEHYAEVLLRRRRKRGYVDIEPQRWDLLELEAEIEARLTQVRRRLGNRRKELRVEARSKFSCRSRCSCAIDRCGPRPR